MKNGLDSLRQWIKSERKARDLTLVQLAERTRLTQSNLSQIEKGDTQISLFTLIRILHAFRLSYISLLTYGIIDGPNLMWLENALRNAEFELPTFTLGDVDDFIAYRKSTLPILERWTQYFINKQLGFSEQAAEELISDAYELMLLPKPDATTPPKIGKVIYPTGMPIDLIRNNYYSGGALLLFDLAAYIKQTRLRAGLSRYQLADAIGRTHTGIRHLETKISARTLFIDILNLDNALGTNGELLALAWRVGELYLGIYRVDASATELAPYTDGQIRWFTRMLVLLRLFQYYEMEQEARSYIDEMRSQAVPYPQPQNKSNAKQIDTLGIATADVYKPLTWPPDADQQNTNSVNDGDTLEPVFLPVYQALREGPQTADEKMDLMADLQEIEREIRKGDQISLSFLRRRLVAFKSMAPDVARRLLSNLASPDSPVSDDVRKIAQKILDT